MTAERYAPNHLHLLARKVPLQCLVWPELDGLGLKLYLRRDDLVSPQASGNKFYKLFFNVQQAITQNKTSLLSFGGAYSNHLHALACLGQSLSVDTIGLVRGQQPQQLSPTLLDAQRWGMELHFLNRRDYRAKSITAISPELDQLIESGDVFCIPEGGSNEAGVRGCMVIGEALAEQLPDIPYTLCSAVATGTTFAGLIAGSPDRCNHMGFSVLKGEDQLTAHVKADLMGLNKPEKVDQFILSFDHHAGGYAKVSDELLAFMARFEARNDVLIDPVYTAKMLLGIEKMALQGYWSPDSTVVAIHTGGSQGRRGYPALSDSFGS